MNFKLFKQQSKAWKDLNNPSINEVLYGGGVAGGKSFLGCLWVVTMCLTYNGTRYIIGRTVLHTLKHTTFVTLMDVIKLMGLKPDQHFTFNGSTNTLKFYNGSEIILKNLEYTPSDPNYESLQGYEVTGVFVDEASQITMTCYNILKSRIRYKLNEYNLTPKILLTCNPGNNYLKELFYNPYIEGVLPSNMSYVPSLVSDNPNVNKDYINTLQTLPEQQRRRLLEGDWNYSDDINLLFNYDKIRNTFYLIDPNDIDKKYITVDVARFGDDRSVIVVWSGLTIIDIKYYKKIDTTQLTNKINEFALIYKVPYSNIVIDADGVGGGVVDQVKSKSFVNNSSPIDNENFNNLKSQCYVYLSRLINEDKISINISDDDIKNKIIEELLSVRLKNVDKDGKIQVIPKDEQKKLLGHSPDFSDAIMMRMYLYLINKEHKSNRGKYIIA